MKHLLAIAFTLLGTISCLADEVQFRSFGTDQGLSNNHVNAVFKDSRGFVWIGTASGLNRYDGYDFQLFQCQRPDTTRLHDNYIQELQEDKRGRLWVFAGDQYSIFNPETEKFHWLNDIDLQSVGIPDYPNRIRIAGDDFWFAVRAHGMYRKIGEQPTECIVSLPQGEDITDIALTPEHNIAAGITDKGCLYITTYSLGGVTDSTEVPRMKDRKEDYSLFIDQSDRLWVYSVEGVNVYDTQNRQWVDTLHIAMPTRPVKGINQDLLGRIWIGYDNDGLEIIDTDGSSRVLVNDPADDSSLGNNSVKSVYRDRDGGMWIGTYKNGVSAWHPNEYKFEIWKGADVNCITPDPTEAGYVWIGTDRKGLWRYNYVLKKAERVDVPGNENGHAIVCMATDMSGTLWIGTYNHGLKAFRNGRFHTIGLQDGLSSLNIWGLLCNADGTLWIATLGGGLQLYNPATGKFTTYTSRDSALASNYISSISRGRDGDIYIGTTNGISILNPNERAFTSRRGNDAGTKTFANHNVNQMFVDSRSLYWICTREGLNVYDWRTDSIYDVQLRPDNSKPFILGIEEDQNRSLWVTVDAELFNINVEFNKANASYSFNIKSYGLRDGLTSGMFNQRSMCLLPSGELLAGNLGGFVHIDPARIQETGLDSHVILTSLRVKGEKIEGGIEYNGKVIIDKAIDIADGINLRHDQNDLDIIFATDNYGNFGKTMYEYCLVGFDKDWRQCALGDHTARYTNLPPGKYNFKVRTINNDGTPSAHERTMAVVIGSPWWSTWWAATLFCILLAGSILYSLRHIKELERRKFQQHAEQEKARKAEELTQLKFKFFTNISHELRTPLTLILSPVESLLKDCDEPQERKRLLMIKNNASRLLYLVNQLLDFRKNEMAGLTLHNSSGDIVETVRNITETFAEISEYKQIKVAFSSPLESLQMTYDNDKIVKAISNLLSNALKYTPSGGSIGVSVCRDSDDVLITVADTGKGVSDEDKTHIFERFYRSSDSSDLNTGSGIGLSLVAEYTRLHKGTVEIADNTPTGAIFTIRIPYHFETDVAEHKPEANISEPTSVVSPEEATKTEENAPGRSKVLFVDDNHDLTEFMKEEFGREFDISCASDGLEALDLVAKNDFDLIVSDIMMPNMDGIELCRRLKSDSATISIPLIMLTAKQDVDSMVEGLTLGADDYLTKPFNNDILAVKIRKLIDARRRGATRTLIEPTPSNIKITSLDEQLVEKAVAYVEENMSRPDLTVEELSNAMGMSRVHFYKKVLALTGKTPVEFIRVLRLKRAAQYLRESQLNVAEIAYKLGFNNPKYFSKYFKEEYGITPSEYQEKEGI